MKKIYSLALATICALSASALSPIQTAIPQTAKKFSKSGSNQTETIQESKKLSPLRATVDDYVGEYDWNYTSGFDGKSYVGSVTIEKGTADRSVLVHFTTPEGNEFYADGTVNQLTGSLTLQKTTNGTLSNGAELILYGVNFSNDNTVTEVAMTSTFNQEAGTITFDRGLYFFLSTADLINDARGYVCTYANSFTPPSNWETLGTGKFKDAFLSTIYGIPLSSCPEVDVTVLYNANIDGMFRIVDPYDEVFGSTGTIEIDATDPEYVLIPQQSMGFMDEDDGETFIMSKSYAYAYLMASALDKAAFLSTYGAYNMTYDKANGRINMPANSFFARWPYATGDGTTGTSPYSLFSSNNSGESYLILPADPAAIGNIAADADINAPVEYFNLQGMKIENPEAGQIVIRRQGSTVTKMLTR